MASAIKVKFTNDSSLTVLGAGIYKSQNTGSYKIHTAPDGFIIPLTVLISK